MSLNKHKLLMISGIGASALAQGKKGGFYYMLEEFSKYWKRVDIICPKVQSAKCKVQSVHGNVFIHSSPWSKIFQPFFILKKGIEIYKKEKFDLFTVHSYPPFYNDIGGRWLFNKLNKKINKPSKSRLYCSLPKDPTASPMIFRTCSFPYILEVMHIAGYPKAGSFKEWFYKILTKLFIKYNVKKAKAIRIINQKQTPEFLKKVKINEKKIKYIPAFYIDFDIFKPQETAKKYDLVFSGRLVKSKGIFLLLKAIKSIKHQASSIKLVIVGSGPLEGKIRKYIKKNKLENNVVFSGWLATVDDLAKVYNQSKIFVMPSFNEGGPRTPLEAMACKVPVITSRVGIMIDIIKSGENGLFINWDTKDIAKKVMKLLADDNLYKKIAENGYKTVQKFERKKAIKNYAETYQKLI